jgi:cell division protein FtsL
MNAASSVPVSAQVQDLQYQVQEVKSNQDALQIQVQDLASASPRRGTSKNRIIW